MVPSWQLIPSCHCLRQIFFKGKRLSQFPGSLRQRTIRNSELGPHQNVNYLRSCGKGRRCTAISYRFFSPILLKTELNFKKFYPALISQMMCKLCWAVTSTDLYLADTFFTCWEHRHTDRTTYMYWKNRSATKKIPPSTRWTQKKQVTQYIQHWNHWGGERGRISVLLGSTTRITQVLVNTWSIGVLCRPRTPTSKHSVKLPKKCM